MKEKKYFGTDGIRGITGGTRINPEFMMKLGWAFGQTLKGDKPKVIIGKDTRLSGYMLETALQAGLTASGVDIEILGPMPTPGISFLTRTLPVSGGIVISASHNPYYDNGIKLFDADGFKLCDDKELNIERQLDAPFNMVSPEKVGKAHRLTDAAKLYLNFCQQSFDRLNLSSLKLVVDCAHGAMYSIAPQMFERLGAQIKTIGCQPDGLNINDKVGSTNPKTIQQEVLNNKGYIGIAFDGDGDRVLLVDEAGELVDGDDILYIIAKAKQQDKTLQGGVVGTLMTNFGVERAFNELNIPFKRSAVGDRYVLDELVQSNWQIGGETSGHIIDLNKATTGDGLIAALLVLEQIQRSGETLHELRQGLKKCQQTLINIKAQSGKKVVQSPEIQDSIKAQQDRLGNGGRIVLRPSGTEPLVRVMVEADDIKLTQEVAKTLAEVVSQTAEKASQI